MEPDKDNFQASIITFKEAYELSHQLSLQIINSGLSFDHIIAIARGGVTPARLLCDFLNIDNLTSVQVRHYTAGAQQLEKAEVVDPVTAEIKNKNVLLVDDVNDSGKTFQAAVDHLKTFEPGILKTAVLHEKETTVFKTDFRGKKLEEWEWLIYQWAATEDILEFLSREDIPEKNEDEALRHLAENYGLKVDRNLFRIVMQMRENYKSEK